MLNFLLFLVSMVVVAAFEFQELQVNSNI